MRAISILSSFMRGKIIGTSFFLNSFLVSQFVFYMHVACLELAIIPGCPSTSFSAPHGSGVAFGGVDNRTFGGSL